MSAKTSPARRAAFMAAVAETGNRTLACERAKVSQSWVTLHRATDPAFRAELEAAVATARARLAGARAAGESMAPGRGLGSQRGEELVVRAGNGRRTQIARARLKQWTPRVEARFLEVLAECANVKAACAAVGLSQTSAYNHRNRWQSFSARWDAALEIGYERVEMAMVSQLGMMLGSGLESGADADGIAPDLTITHMTCDAALLVLQLHQRRVRGAGKLPGAVARPKRTAAEVNASLTKKLDALDRRRGMTQEAAAAAEQAVARGAAAVARLGGSAG